MSFFTKKIKRIAALGFLLVGFAILSMGIFNPTTAAAATFTPGGNEQTAMIDGKQVKLLNKKISAAPVSLGSGPDTQTHYLYQDEQGTVYIVGLDNYTGNKRYSAGIASDKDKQAFTSPSTGFFSTGQVVTDANGNVVAAATTATGIMDPNAAPDKAEAFRCVIWDWTGGTWNACVGLAAYTFLGFCSWFVFFAAIAFNASIDYGLNMANLINDIPIVELGWTTFRDLTSIFFVFIILYIAINTIIGNSSYGAKALLGKVIIGAILINFSLFFTKVIIDASNIVALQFYAKITLDAKLGSANTGNSGQRVGIDNPTNHWDSGISAQFADAMGLQTLWNGPDKSQTSGVKSLALNSKNLTIVGVMGGTFLLITATVFLAGAIMFLIRSIVFIFLMVLSPLAFMGSILPSTKGYTKVWWDKLFANAIFAPVYMIFMYAILSMVLTAGKQKVNFIDMFKENVDFTQTFITYFVLNALMLASLLIANKLGAEGAGWATGIASKATFGTAGWLGRNTFGNIAGRMAQSESTFFGKNAQTGIGRGLYRTLSGVSNRSFDFRNLNSNMNKKFNLGAGAEGGYSKDLDNAIKRKTAYAETLGAEGRRAYASSLHNRSWLHGKGAKKSAEKAMGSSLAEGEKEISEMITEIDQDPDIKKYNKYMEKVAANKALGTEEQAEFFGGISPTRGPLRGLKSEVESRDEIKYKRFDEKTGSWTGKNSRGDDLKAKPADALKAMKAERAKAQQYKRSKAWK